MAAFTGHLPRIVPGIYLGASLITFLAYALDKSAATRNAWRTQESTLHLFALLGGWPGALAAQRLLRHKTVKTSFQRAFWLVVAINCGAIVWLASANGARTLKNILAGL